METLFGVILFIAVAGGLTLVVVVASVGGLAVSWREAAARRRAAQARGWRHAHGSYSGEVAGAEWTARGVGPGEDSPESWIEFSAVYRIRPGGGFMIGVAPEGDEASWPPAPAQPAAHPPLWAADADWAGLWTADLDAPWQRAGGRESGVLSATFVGSALRLRRDCRGAEPTDEQVVATAELGERLLARMAAIAGPQLTLQAWSEMHLSAVLRKRQR